MLRNVLCLSANHWPATPPKLTIMTDQELMASYVDAWEEAVRNFLAVVRDLPADKWELPTDLDGWNIKDIVAHTAHLEAVLAGAPEETIEVAPAPHLRHLMSYYTEQGVLARRDRSMSDLVAEIERAAAVRLKDLRDNPPTDCTLSTRKTPGDVGWTDERLLSNRPLDVWVHEQDIRRALGVPGGHDSLAARHVVNVFARGLPMVIGKKVAPPTGTTIVVEVPAFGVRTETTIGDDGRAAPTSGLTPTATISMSPEDFVVACSGRRAPTDVAVTGDRELASRVVAGLAMTP